MPAHLTRAIRHRPAPGYLLQPGQEVASPETRLRYRARKLLGQGGFGQVFLAKRLGKSDVVPPEVCIKVSAHQDAWVREAYFGLLLREHPRAIRVFDRFPMRSGDVRGLGCGDHLKEIIYCGIGERRKRYDTADELIEALRNPPAALKPGALRSLKGMHIAFTGFLSKPRSEAMRAARRAGAIVHGGPSAKTSVIVRGRPNKLQAAGADGGRKLLEIKRLRERGQRITILTEAQFWRLTK